MIEYLDVSHVVAMHDILVKKYGGILGLRDKGLLESAVMQPQQSAFGEDLFSDIFSKAAAYAYYISENQPFLDGNKRSATASAITFLRMNGYDFTVSEKALYDTMMDLANKRLSKEGLADWFKKYSKNSAKTRQRPQSSQISKKSRKKK